MLEKGELSIREAWEWLTKHGLKRSLVWMKTVVYGGKIPAEKKNGLWWIKQDDLKKALKNPPHLKVIVKMIFIALLFCPSARALEAPIAWQGVVIHHSDSTHMTLEECNAWHRQRGWESCGYNFIIEPDGSLVRSRGFDKVGAHARGFNHRFLGIVLVGKESITPQQLQTLKKFIAEIRGRYGALPLFPHSRVGHTLCPSAAIWREIKSEIP